MKEKKEISSVVEARSVGQRRAVFLRPAALARKGEVEAVHQLDSNQIEFKPSRSRRFAILTMMAPVGQRMCIRQTTKRALQERSPAPRRDPRRGRSPPREGRDGSSEETPRMAQTIPEDISVIGQASHVHGATNMNAAFVRRHACVWSSRRSHRNRKR